MKTLKKHYQYTHVGDYFSKLLFFLESSQDSPLLIITKSQQDIESYTKLAHGIGQQIGRLSNYHELANLCDSDGSGVFLMHMDELKLDIAENIFNNKLTLRVGESYSNESLNKILVDLGYEFHEYEKPWSFQRKGDILQITQKQDNIRVSFWGDEIESIEESGIANSQIQLSSLQRLGDTTGLSGQSTTLQSFIIQHNIPVILDELEFESIYEILSQSFENCRSIDVLRHHETWKQHENLGVESLKLESLQDFKEILSDTSSETKIISRHHTLISKFLTENNLGHISLQAVSISGYKSFRYKNLHYICDDQINNIFIKKRSKKKLSEDIDLLLKIQNGDFVVHIDHGIGIFKGIIKKTLGSIEREYLEISYKNEDKLFVPITEVGRVSKYIGSENPQITPLSGKVWEKKMQKVHEDIREVAENLLKNFAERKIRTGDANLLLQESVERFQSAFPYNYTPDQADAIEEIHKDMTSQKNMDRLVVGDVGFGKTEIAFNAAYLSLINKKQVALISPLVVLAHEHYAKAKERFKEFGINVAIITRLQSQRYISATYEKIAKGEVDLIIGTHRLLSEKITYKNLGLLIVDEEHKFGVSDKEKIKNIRANIDILSLSATPIPRSLNLALSGIRDISLLRTPPRGRKSIDTSIISFNEKLIQDAGEREFARGGQVFFVHNRVTNIEVIRKQIQRIFPKRKIIITHGQLQGEELENRIIAFKEKEYDILLSTTVIENGIDFPNVNTIFINECQSFGISQIHQLRGRVGRSDLQGYCYLLYKKELLDPVAAKRLQTIVDYSFLGAGFELAMKDLEVRGGGDILGVRQSGQSSEIGVALFLKMLEEKIEELQSQEHNNKALEKPKTKIPVKIDIMISAGIPDNYFMNETDKINFYREIESIQEYADLEYIRESLFENTQHETLESIENLFLLLELQLLCQEYQIESIKKVGINYQIDLQKQSNLENLKTFLSLDSQGIFFITTPQRVRAATKEFANDILFLKYLLQLLSGKVVSQRYRLKKKTGI